MRRCLAKARVGASGLFKRRKRQPIQSVATVNDTTVAAAALATPICGRPAQPRINAGVNASPTAVEMANV